jgi:hypothetical protein
MPLVTVFVAGGKYNHYSVRSGVEGGTDSALGFKCMSGDGWYGVIPVGYLEDHYPTTAVQGIHVHYDRWIKLSGWDYCL